MSIFVDDKDGEKIDLGNGEWITVKKEFSYADVAWIGTLDMDDMDKNIAILEKFSIEWSAKDSEGESLPLVKENLKKLKVNVFTKVVNSLVDHMKIDEASKKK